MLIAVLFFLGEELGVEHGRIAQMGVVTTTEDSPRQLRLIDLLYMYISKRGDPQWPWVRGWGERKEGGQFFLTPHMQLPKAE